MDETEKKKRIELASAILTISKLKKESIAERRILEIKIMELRALHANENEKTEIALQNYC
jgi:hypothetical protein